MKRGRAFTRPQAAHCPPPPPPTRLSTEGGKPYFSALPLLCERYHEEKQVGKGTYGTVVLGRRLDGNKEEVAIKKFSAFSSNDLFERCAKHEIETLKLLKGHPNIITILDVATDTSRFELYLVLERAHHDLGGLIETKMWSMFFSAEQVKHYFGSIMRGLAYCHSKNVIHRDLKPSNILIFAHTGDTKLADFGMAREVVDFSKMTNEVTTIWYRAPELLYGATEYGASIDVWSAGCIFGELLTRAPMFPAALVDPEKCDNKDRAKRDNETSQLQSYYGMCGTPRTEDWPDALQKRVSNSFRERTRRLDFFEVLTSKKCNKTVATRGAAALLDGLLQLVPKQRVTAAAAMEMDYFSKEYPSAGRPTHYPISCFYAEVHSRNKTAQKKKQQ